ncbi:MAG: hypothetical protein JWM27_4641 [Gemmatimonadetes bacterium]|nr:hypothetical protein [Gemmatimonadota bacterium]
MLKLALKQVDRADVRIRETVPTDDPMWDGVAVKLSAPVEVDLTASSVGEGVLVRGSLGTAVVQECRRCLKEVRSDVEVHVDLLFEPLTAEEEDETEGEVYPIPPRAAEVDLTGPVREQLLLHVPAYALCREDCRGLCPKCGVDRNDIACDCVSESAPSPWDALKKLKND